ncbi:MAG: hypothetical protein IJK31_11110 [Ruminococcus sp.]|nr:hypothetical protein [Ruminococcus sp.]
MKRLAAIMLSVLTLVSAVACSTGNNSNTAPKETVRTVSDESRIFKKSELPYPDKLTSISDILYNDTSDRVYIIGSDTKGKTLCCTADSSFSLYKYAELDIEIKTDNSAVFAVSGDKLYALITDVRYTEDGSFESAEYSYTLITYDNDFSKLSSVSIENADDSISGQASELYIGKDSGLVFAIGMGYVVIDESGKITDTVSFDKDEEHAIAELVKGGRYAYYYSDNAAYYGVKADNSIVKLIDFANSGLSNLRTIAPIADNEFVCVSDNKLYRLSERDSAELANITELTLAAAGETDSIQNTIADFNSGSNLYRVNVKNYLDGHEYSIEGFEAAAHDLEMDIISGKTPDLVWLDMNETEKLASKGAFADLYEFMDKDTKFTRDAFLSNYLQAAETDGHLYSITPSFVIRTMGVKSKYVSGDGWTFEHFRETYASRPDGMELFEQGNNRNGVFLMLSNGGADFIDLKSHACSFDSDSFIDILEFSAQFPDLNSYDGERRSCRRDTALLSEMYFQSFRDINVQKQCVFGDDMTLIGAPSENGQGSSMILSNQFSIMSDSDNKEGAWEFIKLFLADECYSGNPNGIPVTENGLKKVMDAALEKPYYIDTTCGNTKVYMDETTTDFYSGERINVTPMTADEQKKYEQFVRSITRISSGNTELSISRIIDEETAYFFAGDHSAEQCAEMIQNRVSIMLSEQQ